MDIVLQDGDVVYCDIPYGNTEEYDNPFNRAEFFNWCCKQRVPVYISEYEIDDDRFVPVEEKARRGRYSSHNKKHNVVEKLYTINETAKEKAA